MRPDSITLAIFEKYTAEELATAAQQMAQAVSEMESTEVEKKVSDAAFNERIKKHAAAVSELAKKYNKGGETAQIGCDIRYDHPEPGKKSYFRMDRNELVETHDMTWEEKQETIQFPLAEAAAPEPSVSDLSAASLEQLAAGIEEVTQMCPYPNCIHFADHDGEHEFADHPAAEADAAASSEEQAREKKRKKMRGQNAILPDTPKTDPPQPGAQA